MHRREFQQPHLAVKPRARIPARRLRPVLQQHGEFVPARMQGVGDLAPEGAVTVGPEADLAAVDQHAGLAHRAVEQQHITPVSDRINMQCPPVSPLADIGQSARASRLDGRGRLAVLNDGHLLQVVLARERPRDGPVMGYLHLPPSVGAPDVVVVAELPVGEQLFVTRVLCAERRGRTQGA